jgi:hypothetical protein
MSTRQVLKRLENLERVRTQHEEGFTLERSCATRCGGGTRRGI